MINLNLRRNHPLSLVEIRRSELANIDLDTVAAYDWMEGVGDLKDLAVIGFLHQLSRAKIRLVPEGEITIDAGAKSRV